jgi:bacteriocin-like protein
MKTITTTELTNVTGGTSAANNAVTQQLTALQGSIKDLASAQTNKSSTSDPTTMMMMMMAMRPQQPAVVAAPATAAAPVVNISTRVRRW